MAGDEFFPDDTAAPPADTSAFDGARGAGGRGRNDRRSGSGGGGGTRGRVPPHNMSAEESVLGALLLSRDAMNAVSELSLRPGDFYKPAHQRIFDAIRSLYSSGAPVDVVTVADELRRNGVLDEVGGAGTLHELQNATPAVSSAGHYARIVQDTATLRQLIYAAAEISELAYGNPDDVVKAVDEAESKVFAVGDQRSVDSIRTLESLLPEVLDHLESIYDRKNKITGVPTGYADLDELLTGLQPSALYIVGARPAMGKCVAFDTPIVDPSTGDVLTAQELMERAEAQGSMQAVSLGADARQAVTDMSNVLADGIKPVFTVRTRSGREVTITASHPLLTPRGWRELDQVEVGTPVAVPTALPVFGHDSLPSAEVDLLALLLGDGSVGPGRTSPSLTSALPEVVEVAASAAVHFGARLRVEGHAGAATTYRISGGRSGGAENPVTAMLRRHGLWGHGAHTKQVPAAVFRLPEAQLAQFLNRLFATDGSAWVAAAGYARVSYSSVSGRLARDVQHLLLRFGVRAKLRERQVKYVDAGEQSRRTSYEVEVIDAPSLLSFADRIGILGKDAAVARVRAVAAAAAFGYSGDAVPVEVWDDVMKAKGDVTWAEINRRTGRPLSHNWHPYRGRVRRAIVAQLAQALDSDVLRWWASPDVLWDDIVAIDPAGWTQVIDFTVPGLHNFVAADMYLHNTAFGLGMAVHAAQVSGKPALVFSLEMAHQELAQRVLASEARVDSTKLRTGELSDTEWQKIGKALARLEVPLFLDDNPRVTVMEIRAKARRIAQQHGGLSVIVVDYIQLMGGSGAAENRQLEVSEISRNLKILARELKVPIVALSQLSRNLEARADKRPMLSDLRESGCLTADTRLVRADTNAEVTLGELVESGERGFPVWSLDEHYRLVPATLTAAFPSGVKETFRLRLASGRHVDASSNHPFLTLDGWTRVDSLTKGTRIAAARRLPEAATVATMSDAQLVLLGHLIGDGCTLDRHAAQYTTVDPDNVRAVVEAAEEFGVEARVKAERTWTQVYLPSPHHLTHGVHHPISNWLRSLGTWNLRSWEKHVPAALFAQPTAQIALFLRHLWATDGSVSAPTRASGARIYYATTSRQLADDVAALLLRLDISARVRTVPHAVHRTSYHVDISGRDEQLRFAEVVGVHGARSRRLEALVEAISTKESNTNVDTIPADVWEYVRRKALPAAQISTRELARRLDMQYCGSTLYKHGVSRDRMGRVARATGDPWLADLAASDVLWDTIVAIEPLGPQPVFDATIDTTHNFVANGIVAHNSLEQDADVVMFLYRDEVYHPESPDKGSAEVIVAKHRAGPIGIKRLVFLGQYTRFDNAAKTV